MKQVTVNTEKGFTLVEVMVGLALGSLMLLGIFKIFDANFAAYNLLIADSNIQESTRIARSIMLKDIQNAGSLGCHKEGQTFINSSQLDTATSPKFGLNEDKFAGFTLLNNVGDNKTISALSDLHTDNDDKEIEKGTDVLGLIKATALSVQMRSINGKKITMQGNAFNTGDYLMIMTCTAKIFTEVFQIQSIKQNGNQQELTLNWDVTQGVDLLIGPGGQLMAVSIYKLEAISYFVAESISSTAADKRLSLYRKVNNNTADEYVAGVDDLQIAYESADGNRSYIEGASTSTDNEFYANVVHVNLVLRSDSTRTNNVFTGPDFGKTNGANYADDGKLRRLAYFSGKIRSRK